MKKEKNARDDAQKDRTPPDELVDAVNRGVIPNIFWLLSDLDINPEIP